MNRRTRPDEPVTDGLVWDDRLWDLVWERTLDQLERHQLTLQVLLRRPPPDAFAARVGRELARRLRRRAVVLAVAWGLFTAFWAMILHLARQQPGTPDGWAWSMVLLGTAVVVGCVAFRRRLGPVAHDPDVPAVPPGGIG